MRIWFQSAPFCNTAEIWQVCNRKSLSNPVLWDIIKACPSSIPILTGVVIPVKSLAFDRTLCLHDFLLMCWHGQSLLVRRNLMCVPVHEFNHGSTAVRPIFNKFELILPDLPTEGFLSFVVKSHSQHLKLNLSNCSQIWVGQGLNFRLKRIDVRITTKTWLSLSKRSLRIKNLSDFWESNVG